VLVEAGCNIEAADKLKRTAVIHAARNGQLVALNYLLRMVNVPRHRLVREREEERGKRDHKCHDVVLMSFLFTERRCVLRRFVNEHGSPLCSGIWLAGVS
jgi:hypothetical protein